MTNAFGRQVETVEDRTNDPKFGKHIYYETSVDYDIKDVQIVEHITNSTVTYIPSIYYTIYVTPIKGWHETIHLPANICPSKNAYIEFEGRKIRIYV